MQTGIYSRRLKTAPLRQQGQFSVPSFLRHLAWPNSVFAGDSHGPDAIGMVSDQSWAEKTNTHDVSKVLLIESTGVSAGEYQRPPLTTGKQEPVNESLR